MAYKLQDLIDLELFQHLQDRLNGIYSFPSAIIDNDGNILTATAWQDICTQFHRKNKDCEQHCIESDRYILSHLHEANPAVSYRCPHGLVDNAAPIIVDGVHYGNFFTGQFFLEEPDMGFFKMQADRYGFDEGSYLDAVRRVPVWSQEQLDNYIFFIKGLIAIISESGLRNLKEIEARERIEESVARSNAIVQTAMDGYWSVDMAGRFLEVNDTYCRMSGYSEQELLAMGIPDLEVLETESDVAARIHRIMMQGEGRFESRHRRKDGQLIDVEVSTQYRPADGGRFVVFIRDITDRKQSEEKEALRKKQLALITDNFPGPVSQVDQDLRYQFANSKYEHWFGVTKETIVGMRMQEVLGHQVFRNAETHIQKALAGEAVEFEASTITPTGETLHGLVNYVPYYDNENDVSGFFIFVTDTTSRRKAEESQKKLEERLLGAQRMESVGRLAGGIAHDFNNMLSVILGNVELAMASADTTETLGSVLLEIQSAAQHSAELTRQLLAFARKQTVVPKVLDLNEMVDGGLKMLKRLIGEHITLSWRPCRDLGRIKIDPSQIDQILANLCVNARDAIESIGEVAIGTANIVFDEEYCVEHTGSVPGEYVMLEVGDNGVGMDNETLSHIFEPFYTSKEKGEGTGLGLATVYGIVMQNGGSITVESDLGKGTSVKIYLPRAVSNAVDMPAKNSLEETQKGTETILLVEDEPALLRLGKTVLEGLGYSVMASSTPGEAIRVADAYTGQIHLLLTDVVMPEMNGHDLARTLISSHPNLRSLFMSGYAATIIGQEGILDDGVNFIQKPFSMKDLADKVRMALEQE
jgi:two-component system, cell cycle sensor histidine kinase and response regulator CckA